MTETKPVLRELTEEELAKLRGTELGELPLQPPVFNRVSKHIGSRNHGQGTPKKAQKTAKKSRRINRQRCK